MTTSNSQDPLVRAISLHHEFMAAGRSDHEVFLAQHEDLRELLEPMLCEVPVGTDDGADPADRRIGDFRIVREIGRGGMGVVYLAEQVSLGRLVALKVLPELAGGDERARARFEREAQLAAGLDHENITKVHAVGREDGRSYFAMEIVRGAALAAVIEELAGGVPTTIDGVQFAGAVGRRSLSVVAGDDGAAAKVGFRGDLATIAVDIAIQVADALDHSHNSGVVHRDVKPGNILVRADGTAVLTDFGVARGDDAVSLTRTGDFAGTPSYSSPEQLRGGAVDHRADVFALGATLYELLTLRQPFAADSISETRIRIERHDPPPPSRHNRSVSRDVDAVVLRALEKEPGRRYQSAREFAAELRAVRDGRPVLARPVGRATRAARWCRRNPIAAGLLGTIAGSLAVVSVLAGVARANADDAEANLQRFQSVRVVEEVRRLKRELELLPGPLPANVDKLAAAVGHVRGLLARLPELERLLDDLRASGQPCTAVDPYRLLTAHPAEMRLRDRQLGAWAMESRLRQLQQELREYESIDDREGLDERWVPLDSAWVPVAQERITALRGEADQLRALVDARRRVVIDDPNRQFLHDTLEDQIAELRWMEWHRLPQLEARLRWARDEAAGVAAASAAAWERDGRLVARDPRFGGFELRPQPGLVPLGPDPESGLPEYADPRSGAVPMRDDEGHLRLDADSALVFVLVPGGPTLPGAYPKLKDQPALRHLPRFDEEASMNELPPPSYVTLDPFLLSKYEVTHVQWDRLAEGLGIYVPAYALEARDGYETKPIIQVTWADCEHWCRANAMELPTETQWEHACRSGGDTRWWTGKDPASLWHNENVMDVPGTEYHKSSERPAPIVNEFEHGRWPVYGTVCANPFGLHHMHGNVQEWCRDPWVANATRQELRPGDGLRGGAAATGDRAVRGGAYALDVYLSRSSARNLASPQDRKNIIGLRPARVLVR